MTHPFSSLAMFASGARRDVVDRTPSDRVWLSVLGTFVLLASVIAGFGAFATAGFVRHGGLWVGKVEIAWGLAWALIIFVFDRAIIRMPLLPVRLNDNVVGMLWNPATDVKWYVEVGEGKAVRFTHNQWSRFPALAFAAIPRVVVAVAASFIFAETLLFVYFKEDLASVIQNIAQVNRESLYQQAQLDYNKRRADLEKQVAEVANGLDRGTPSMEVLEGRRTDQESIRSRASSDASAFGELYSKERAAVQVTVKLSDGSSRTTSGNPDSNPNQAGIQSGSYLGEQRKQEAIRDNANREIHTLTAEIDKRTALIQTDQKYTNKKADLNALKPLSVDQIDPSVIKGVGIRRAALAAYSHDANPVTPQLDVAKDDCSKGNFVCRIWRRFVPNTPAGPMVGAMRAIFLFLELMPLFGKIAFTLRRSRPYDEKFAEEEVLSSGESLVNLSRRLSVFGEEIESDGRRRRSMRSADSAEYIIARSQHRNENSRNGSSQAPRGRWYQWSKQSKATSGDTEESGVRRPPGS